MRALIVDDERLARAELRRLLEEHPDIEIVGEARSGEEALGQIPQLRPDVLFLDVQMPGMTGFELVEKLDDLPDIIFTTAYDQYALKAFEINALDYLVKPVAPERLASSLSRLRQTSRPQTAVLERVFLRDGERCWIVPVADILLLESEGNYTRVFFRGEKPLIPRSLAALEARLPADSFFRAGRRYIVNLNAIDRVEPSVAGNLSAVLRTGQTVEFSRRQSIRLREQLSL